LKLLSYDEEQIRTKHKRQRARRKRKTNWKEEIGKKY